MRELAQSGQLDGERGGYICQTDVADVTVPATVQATIAARIDRLNPVAKRTLSAAAVIGLRFSADLLTRLGADAAVEELVAAELIDQVRFTQDAEYAFHHPLIRAGGIRVPAEVRPRRVAPTGGRCDRNNANRTRLRSMPRSSPSISKPQANSGKPTAGICAQGAGRPDATSPRRERVGSAPGGSPMRCRTTNPNAPPCELARASGCVVAPGGEV